MNEDWLTDVAREALWFSAKLRFRLSFPDTLGSEYEDRVYLFQSPNQDAATAQAAQIGREHELHYRNLDGGRVEWRFAEVIAVRMTFLDTPLSQGIEIYSERVSRE